MVRTEHGGVAHQLTTILAEDLVPELFDRKLYVIDGHPGLFRRVKTKHDKPVPLEGAWKDWRVVPALFVDQLIYLVFDGPVTVELQDAGIARPVAVVKSDAAMQRALASAWSDRLTKSACNEKPADDECDPKPMSDGEDAVEV